MKWFKKRLDDFFEHIKKEMQFIVDIPNGYVFYFPLVNDETGFAGISVHKRKNQYFLKDNPPLIFYFNKWVKNGKVKQEAFAEIQQVVNDYELEIKKEHIFTTASEADFADKLLRIFFAIIEIGTIIRLTENKLKRRAENGQINQFSNRGCGRNK